VHPFRWLRASRLRTGYPLASLRDSGLPLLRFRVRHLLRVARLAQRDVDRVRALEERDGRAGAHTKTAADLSEVPVALDELQTLLRGFYGLFAIPGGVINGGEVRIVVAVVELEVDRAAAETGSRNELAGAPSVPTRALPCWDLPDPR